MISNFETIDSHIRDYNSKLFTSLPASIEKVHTQDGIKYVDVKPSIRKAYVDGVTFASNVIYNVPVVFPSGGGGILSFPLEVGDTVLLVFAQRDITNFLEGDGSEVSPETLRTHDINDAIAIPGLYPFSKNLSPNDKDVELKYNDSTILLKQDGGVEVTTSSGDVEINTASKFVVDNGTEELVALMSEFLQTVSEITVSTIYGPVTVINNKAAVTSLKNRLDTFKK